MIPGIITSTASIAGLLALQLYVICQNKDYRTFMTGNMNLADNTLALAIPLQKIEETKNKRKYHNNIVWSIIYKNLSYFMKRNNIIKIIVLVIILTFIINK